MPEAVATLAPSGAGRLDDWILPSRLTAMDVPVFPEYSQRNGSASSGFSVSGAPANDVQAGVACLRFATTIGNQVLFLGGPIALLFRPVASAIIGDDQRTYRVIWLFKGSGVAPNPLIDFGLEIARVQLVNGRILQEGADGFGVRLNGTALDWIVRGPNGLITQTIADLPAFDITGWHSLDMRITSASDTAPATLDVRLDDAVVNLGAANTSWAPGTNLPSPTLVAGSVGFRVLLTAGAGNVNDLWTHQLRLIAAPSVLATL